MKKKIHLCIVIAVVAFIAYIVFNDQPVKKNQPTVWQPTPQDVSTHFTNRKGRHLYDPQDTAGLAVGKRIFSKMLNAAINIANRTGNKKADTLIQYAKKYARICLPIDDYSIRSLEPVDTGSYFLPVVVLRPGDQYLTPAWKAYAGMQNSNGMFVPNVLALIIFPDDSTSAYYLGSTLLHELQHAYYYYLHPYNRLDFCLKYLDEIRSYELEHQLAAAWGKETYNVALENEMKRQQNKSDSSGIAIGNFFTYSAYDPTLDAAFGKPRSQKDQSGRMIALSMNAGLALINKKYSDHLTGRKAVYIYGMYSMFKLDPPGLNLSLCDDK